MSSFEFTDEDGDKLTARPMLGHPAILLKTSPNGVVIPPERLEEVIAGMRDMARQAGGQAATNQPAEAQPSRALPQLLAATLTERFTALGNPFSRMSINFKGPDGWPATRDVSPNDVADVLKELLGQASGPALPGAPLTAEQYARARETLPDGAVITAAALNVTERQFLTFALDLAFDRMASRGDEFTDEDHATLARFRRMTVGETR